MYPYVTGTRWTSATNHAHDGRAEASIAWATLSPTGASAPIAIPTATYALLARDPVMPLSYGPRKR